MTGTHGHRVSELVELVRADPLLTLLRASLIALLLNSNDDPVVLVAVAVTCLVALPRPRVLRSPWFWGAAFVLVGARQLATWHTIDDHIIATTYWCGALALGLTATEPGRTLAASARLLVGSLFAFAAGWKLLSGQFIDGTFFRYSLLFDDRFEVVARVVGGTGSTLRDANLEAAGRLLATGADGEIVLREGARNEPVALVFTGWGALIESAVAVAFLAPLPRAWSWLRHATLVAFVATTYAVVPIAGFGTLLLVLGAATTADTTVRARYYGGALILALWSMIWPLVFL